MAPGRIQSKLTLSLKSPQLYKDINGNLASSNTVKMPFTNNKLPKTEKAKQVAMYAFSYIHVTCFLEV